MKRRASLSNRLTGATRVGAKEVWADQLKRHTDGRIGYTHAANMQRRAGNLALAELYDLHAESHENIARYFQAKVKRCEKG